MPTVFNLTLQSEINFPIARAFFVRVSLSPPDLEPERWACNEAGEIVNGAPQSKDGQPAYFKHLRPARPRMS